MPLKNECQIANSSTPARKSVTEQTFLVSLLFPLHAVLGTNGFNNNACTKQHLPSNLHTQQSAGANDLQNQGKVRKHNGGPSAVALRIA